MVVWGTNVGRYRRPGQPTRASAGFLGRLWRRHHRPARARAPAKTWSERTDGWRGAPLAVAVGRDSSLQGRHAGVAQGPGRGPQPAIVTRHGGDALADTVRRPRLAGEWRLRRLHEQAEGYRSVADLDRVADHGVGRRGDHRHGAGALVGDVDLATERHATGTLADGDIDRAVGRGGDHRHGAGATVGDIELAAVRRNRHAVGTRAGDVQGADHQLLPGVDHQHIFFFAELVDDIDRAAVRRDRHAVRTRADGDRRSDHGVGRGGDHRHGAGALVGDVDLAAFWRTCHRHATG